MGWSTDFIMNDAVGEEWTDRAGDAGLESAALAIAKDVSTSCLGAVRGRIVLR